MRKPFFSPAGSLTGKLVTAICLLMIIGGSLAWYIFYRAERKDLLDNALSYTASLSELLKRSTRYDMLISERRGIQKTLEFIGASESIVKVRIFNTNGRVSFSSNPGDVGMDAKEFLSLPPAQGSASGLAAPSLDSQWSIVELGQERVLAYVEPIYNAPDCYTAACHVHGEEQKILGHMRTDFSLSPIDAIIRGHMIHNFVYMMLCVIIIAIILSFILWKIVLRPLANLSAGLKQVSTGDLTHKMDVESKDEIGRLAMTFNEMTGELSLARERMAEWNKTLREEVKKKAHEIEQTRDKLIQAEKMAAVGRLTADIAHGIRNPLTALGGFGRRLQKSAMTPTQQEYAQIIVSEVERLEIILKDILEFSRSTEPDFIKIDPADVINDSMQLFIDLCSEQRIEIKMEYGTDLPVLMDRRQVRQALDNLVSNAIDVMMSGGTLTILSREERIHNVTHVVVSVADTGPGIPEDKFNQIFEPFFTTKRIGRGTGLGLPITRKIIEEHGGFIKGENLPEGGFVVSLYFPYQSEDDLAETPCWEFMKCGRDTNNETKCPAFPHFGRTCWAVAGTLCAGRVQGTFAQKFHNCRECQFYKTVNQEEDLNP